MTLKSYLETEAREIERDYEMSGSELPLKEYALEWVGRNAARFAGEHHNEAN